MCRFASSRLRRLTSDTGGVTAIEFAIAVGVLVMVLLASLEIGALLMAKAEMNRALGRVVRVVHLRPETAATEIAERLSVELEADIAWSVRTRPVAGTNYLEVAVSAPYSLGIPFLPIEEVTLRAEALAPVLPPGS